MVGHTHHDYLVDAADGHIITIGHNCIDLTLVKEFTDERELFDVNGNYVRKVKISYLDEHLDDMHDWRNFISQLIDIDCLYIIDDREITNPIMREYGEEMSLKYLCRLKKDGIKSVIVSRSGMTSIT